MIPVEHQERILELIRQRFDGTALQNQLHHYWKNIKNLISAYRRAKV